MLTRQHTFSLKLAGAVRPLASLLILAGVSSLSMPATPITVPNGNFLSSTNAGHIGGAVIGSPISNQGIGSASGPWNGSTSGILGLVAAPSMTISTTGGYGNTGSAEISGVVNTAVIGNPLDNGAFFSQTLSSAFQANTTYTLTADVYTGSVLTASLLANRSVGIALANGTGLGNLLASTTTVNPSLVNLSLLSANCYELSLTYTTGSSVSGNITVDLLDTPSGLATANLFSDVVFSNVTLDAVSPTPEPATMGITGILLVAGALVVRKRKGNVQ
jgi:hypothetical protein